MPSFGQHKSSRFFGFGSIQPLGTSQPGIQLYSASSSDRRYMCSEICEMPLRFAMRSRTQNTKRSS